MNKYDVLGVVGEGAYGVVLKCKNKDTNEVVAIKKFKESEEDEVVKKTTLREVKILRLMRHENIVQLKEAFRRKGKLYLVFEFVEKSMLDILEANPNGVDVDTVRLLTYQLARATEHCHRNDVLHRDIKPENLLINPADHALRLCDFGFARQIPDREKDKDAVLTDYVATRWYRSPELLLGSTVYGKEVDIWAIGCIMGELTDGQPLFAGESEVDQLFVIQKVLGPLTTQQQEAFLRNERLSCYQFPSLPKPETLNKRYKNLRSKPLLELLKETLAMEPKNRISARAILKHVLFEKTRLPPSLRPPSQTHSRMRPDSSSSVAGPPNPANQSSNSAPQRVSEQASLPPTQYNMHGHAEQEQPDQRGGRMPEQRLREDPRLRDDGRSQAREDPRQRDDGRSQAREDSRFLHEDSRSWDHRGSAMEPRQMTQEFHRNQRMMDESRFNPPREEPRLSRGGDAPQLLRQYQPLNQSLPLQQFHNQPALYLPGEDNSHRADMMLEQSFPPDYSQAPMYPGEPEDKGDGRRSRQNRKSDYHGEGMGGTGDYGGNVGGNTPNERLQGDRGTPNHGAGDRGANCFHVAPVGQGVQNSKYSRSNTGSFPNAPLDRGGPPLDRNGAMDRTGLLDRNGPMDRNGHLEHRANAPGFPLGGPQNNGNSGMMPMAAHTSIGAPPNTAPGGPRTHHMGESKSDRAGRDRVDRHESNSNAMAPHVMAQHGVSAGTGGSEDLHSTQSRVNTRQLREQESDDDKAAQQYHRQKPKRKNDSSNVRRSPEMDFQTSMNHQARMVSNEAWNPEAMDLHSGLPHIHSNIHADFPRVQQGFGPPEGSRAPSRLTAGTPTPREEDCLEIAMRGGSSHPSHPFYNRHNAEPAITGLQELGPVQVRGGQLGSHHGGHGGPHYTHGPPHGSHGGGHSHGTPHGSSALHEVRTPQHEPRGPHGDRRLERGRPDLYHGNH